MESCLARAVGLAGGRRQEGSVSDQASAGASGLESEALITLSLRGAV